MGTVGAVHGIVGVNGVYVCDMGECTIRRLSDVGCLVNGRVKMFYIKADGEYHKLERVERIELEEDIRFPTEQTFECVIEPSNWYRFMKFLTVTNNWRRLHGMRSYRWRTLERIGRYGKDNK